MSISPPERIALEGDAYLRWLNADDAEAVARAVGDSLEHLKPWMPWADAKSADPTFQRARLANQPERRGRDEEWHYGLFRIANDEFLGAFGLMTRRGPRTLEVGYWLHVDAGGHGFATDATRALTASGLELDGIEQMIVVCDEANLRSGAIPQRLGYTLDRVETRAPEAPGETGHMQFWITERVPDTPTR